ncbi:g3347 [Coccomyxa elongata]
MASSPQVVAGGFSEQSSDAVNLASPTFRIDDQSSTCKQAPGERERDALFTRTPNSEGSFGFMTPGLTATPASASFMRDTPGTEAHDCWQAAFSNVGAAVPPKVEADSYMAGQRAALMEAFQLMLPGQQQLGSMASNLQRLQSQVNEERLHARQAEKNMAEVVAKVQSLQDRFTTLETFRLPDMDNRIERASTALVSQEFHATLEAMKDALTGISERGRAGYPGAGSAGGGGRGLSGALAGNLIWLLRTAGGYAQRSLSQADVAAVFLSRRILLDHAALQGAGMPRDAATKGSALGAAVRAAVRPALGSAAFLAAVETAWQLHTRWSGLLPRQLRAATAPAALGLRTVRAAVWAAAVLLSAMAARESAFSIVDAGFTVAQRCQEKLAAVVPRSGYLVWAPSTSSSAPTEEDCSTAKGAAAAVQNSVVADSACRIERSETAEAQDAMEKGCSPYAPLLK